MALTEKPLPGILTSDRAALIEILDEYDRQTGFIPDPTATVEERRKARRVSVSAGGGAGISSAIFVAVVRLMVYWGPDMNDDESNIHA